MRKMNLVGLVAMVAVSLSTVVGCGDNSEGPIPGLDENAAGWAGSGDYVAPPAGTGGNTQTGGSGGGNVQTGGSGGSAQAGIGGSNTNPPSGGSGGGSAGIGGAAGCAGEAGTGGNTQTGGAGGSAGSGGTGGSIGTVCTPDTPAPCALSATCMGETLCKADGSGYDGNCRDIEHCNSGTGGSSGSGGSGGTAGSGGSSGTGGTASTLGEMAVTVVAPVSGTHNITLRAQSLDPKPGEVDWNTAWVANQVTRTTYTFKITEGGMVKVNGFYDPETGMSEWAKKFCDAATAKATATIWATYDGIAVPAPEVVVNGTDSCDLVFHAVTLEPTVGDNDGDGDPDVDDCADSDPRRFHGQVETPDDDVDFDCDGQNAPRRVRYRLTTISGLDPVLQDWKRNGSERHMTSVGSGIYEALVEKAAAPVDFTIAMGTVNGWPTWDIGYNSGTCSRPTYVPVTLTVSDEESGSLYNLSSLASYDETTSQWTCHDVVTNL